MKILALNKIDVSRYPIGHSIFLWLTPERGYRVKIQNGRLFLVREV